MRWVGAVDLPADHDSRDEYHHDRYRELRPQIRLCDNLGTDYGDICGGGFSSSGGGPGALHLRGTTRFAVAVPLDAHQLRLTWGGGTSALELPAR